MMTRGVHLTVAAASDAGALADLDGTLTSHPWTRRQFHEEIVAPGPARVLLLRSNEGRAIVGFVVLHVVADEGCIRNLGIARSCQRRGLARFLIRQAASLASGRGACVLHLEVRDGNHGARRLYSSEGFAEEGRRRDYYSAPIEDAILMSLRLSSGGGGARTRQRAVPVRALSRPNS